ncbi:hypothetical protein ACQUSR_20150 [Streptomyces sp. P1-3]|uniref:hypothetical protein n=1 Tax=Streptomyces sp. P1-3 TaxID=3421658 RepID=UPI003D35A565
MTDQPEQAPASPEQQITASVTVTGAQAAILRDLAAVLGRTPESLALEWAAGALVIPSTPLGEDPDVPEWGLFDGPADLSARTDEYLGERFSR